MIYAYLFFFIGVLSFVVWRFVFGGLLFRLWKLEIRARYRKHDNVLVLVTLMSMLVFCLLGITFGLPTQAMSAVIFFFVIFNIVITGFLYVFVYRTKTLVKLWKIIVLAVIHMLATLVATVLSVFALFALFSFLHIRPYLIMGFSMTPDYEHNTMVLVSEKGDPLERNDVAIFELSGETPEETHEFISRIVGVPGDTIIVVGKNVFVNDQAITTYPRHEFFSQRARSLSDRPRQEIVLITSRGIIPAIQELQDRFNEKGIVPELLQGDPTDIAIDNGWFRAGDNFRDVNAAESRLALPGSFLSYNTETIVEYVGFRNEPHIPRWAAWGIPFDFVNEQSLTITDPLKGNNPQPIIIYMDTDGAYVSFEKIRDDMVQQGAFTFALSDDEYFIINDQRFSFINNSPWHIVNSHDAKGVVFSNFNFFK